MQRSSLQVTATQVRRFPVLRSGPLHDGAQDDARDQGTSGKAQRCVDTLQSCFDLVERRIVDRWFGFDFELELGRRVVDTARLLYLGLVLNDRSVSLRETNDLTEELLVYVSRNLGRQDRELVGRLRVLGNLCTSPTGRVACAAVSDASRRDAVDAGHR